MHCSLKKMCRRICTNKTNVPADLQSAGIEYKDFQSVCFLLLIYRYESRIADPDTLCCRIAYPTEHLSCRFSAVAKNLPELNYVATRSHARLSYKAKHAPEEVLL